MNQTLIFKTNVSSPKEKHEVLHSVKVVLKTKAKLSLDLEDCDRVLRIEGQDLNKQEVENIVFRQGFFCEELEDVVRPVRKELFSSQLHSFV